MTGAFGTIRVPLEKIVSGLPNSDYHRQVYRMAKCLTQLGETGSQRHVTLSSCPNAKVARFWIRIGNLGEFLLQVVQNDVHKERPIRRFSWRQHDNIENSDEDETHPKHGLLSAGKFLGPS
jgi:hypothetical protein